MTDREAKIQALMEAVVDGPFYDDVLGLAEGTKQVTIIPRLNGLGFEFRIERVPTLEEALAFQQQMLDADVRIAKALYSRAD